MSEDGTANGGPGETTGEAGIKSLDSFDFLAIPSLNKSLVLDLALCEFIGRLPLTA